MANFAPGSPPQPTVTSILKGMPTSTTTLSVVAATTEYSFTIPSATKRVEWRVRENSRIHWGLNSGDPANTLKFQTLKPGNVAIWELTNTASPLTVYLQSPVKAGITVEILLWS